MFVQEERLTAQCGLWFVITVLCGVWCVVCGVLLCTPVKEQKWVDPKPHKKYKHVKLGLDKNSSVILPLIRPPKCVKLNRNFSPPDTQLAVFEAQLKIASKLNKTVYLHERDAFTAQLAL